MAIWWFKKKRIVHPIQEDFFSEEDWNRFRRMILRRTINNRRRTTSRRIKVEPKLSRFWLESRGRLPPVQPVPVVEVQTEPCRSTTEAFERLLQNIHSSIAAGCSFIGLDPLLPLTHSEDRKLATFQLIRSRNVVSDNYAIRKKSSTEEKHVTMAQLVTDGEKPYFEDIEPPKANDQNPFDEMFHLNVGTLYEEDGARKVALGLGPAAFQQSYK
uniref:Uncharacterized protein n=1 Tax=Solanum lycopersicum TaxID=4081 RepID=A0A3Q7F315_SOLLC